MKKIWFYHRNRNDKLRGNLTELIISQNIVLYLPYGNNLLQQTICCLIQKHNLFLTLKYFFDIFTVLNTKNKLI